MVGCELLGTRRDHLHRPPCPTSISCSGFSLAACTPAIQARGLDPDGYGTAGSVAWMVGSSWIRAWFLLDDDGPSHRQCPREPRHRISTLGCLSVTRDGSQGPWCIVTCRPTSSGPANLLPTRLRFADRDQEDWRSICCPLRSLSYDRLS